jgi:hypothetical protein
MVALNTADGAWMQRSDLTGVVEGCTCDPYRDPLGERNMPCADEVGAPSRDRTPWQGVDGQAGKISFAHTFIAALRPLL